MYQEPSSHTWSDHQVPVRRACSVYNVSVRAETRGRVGWFLLQFLGVVRVATLGFSTKTRRRVPKIGNVSSAYYSADNYCDSRNNIINRQPSQTCFDSFCYYHTAWRSEVWDGDLNRSPNWDRRSQQAYRLRWSWAQALCLWYLWHSAMREEAEEPVCPGELLPTTTQCLFCVTWSGTGVSQENMCETSG